MHKLTAAIASY